jgi:FkbM family methyltransferase
MNIQFLNKVVRQVKVLHPSINELKFSAQFLIRKILKRPHENHLYMLNKLRLDKADNEYLFVDIGANRGQTIQSVRCLRDFQLLSIEPLPFLVDKIRERYGSDISIKILNKAVGNQEGVLDIYVPICNSVYFDGLASLDPDYAKSFFEEEDKFFSLDKNKLKLNQFKVEIIVLDDLDIQPDFLKADVQGAEMAVLEGARKTISKSEPIIILEEPELNKEVDFLKQFQYLPYIYSKDRFYPGYENDDNVIFLKEKHKSMFSSHCFQT